MPSASHCAPRGCRDAIVCILYPVKIPRANIRVVWHLAFTEATVTSRWHEPQPRSLLDDGSVCQRLSDALFDVFAAKVRKVRQTSVSRYESSGARKQNRVNVPFSLDDLQQRCVV